MTKRLLPLVAFLGLTSIAATAQVQSLVASNTAFGLQLYMQLATNSGNLFLSPYSISTCLAMTYAGAGGATEQQMAQVLGFGTNQEQFAATFGELQRQLKAAQQTNAVELDVANALWTQQGFPFLPAFLQTATNQYEANVNQTDFVTSADAATASINDWVAQETRNRIQNILPPGSLTPLTRLVLANAIYFKGLWALSFSPTNTSTQMFSRSGSDQVAVPFMHQPPVSTNLFNYAGTKDFQALELPYSSNQFSMLILLPGQVDGYRQLEGQLSSDFLAGVFAQMRMQTVDIFLPRFTLESSFDLKSALSGMGMTDAFEEGVADFSGIDGAKDLYISQVFHKAWGEVNEAGTEAAAATVTGITTSVAGGTPVFRADHPFLFFIRDNQSGSILFLGRLVDPSQGAATAPQLQVVLSNVRAVALAWPVSTTPFVLQESSSITTTNWTTVTNAPAVQGQQNQVILSPTSGTRFYRLLQVGN